MNRREFRTIYGVDFSGAKLAGRNTWIARIEPVDRSRFRLLELSNLEQLCGTAEREPSLAHLVKLIATSRDAVWGMDFPFGLPIEVVEANTRWVGQLKLMTDWTDGANELGLWCVRRAQQLGDRMHIRRVTDDHAKTPFDCYHYRIIYQTFHGMRDVLSPLARTRGTAILPFQYRKLATAHRVVLESCPGSTLKRLGLPHNNYKQPQGGPLTARRRRTRRVILERVMQSITIAPRDQLRILRNPGGDALDAVIAALGAAQSFASADHRAIATHARYPLEGYLYV